MLAKEYYDLTEKPLGVTGEIAEVEAARLLNLELEQARSAGYDAIGKSGECVQIKGRRKAKDGNWGMVPSINTDKHFDTVALVLMNEAYDTLEIWTATRDQVVCTLNKPGSKARNERRAMSVTKFKQIGTRVWPLGT